MEPTPLADLVDFRRHVYQCLTQRADALFELTDALLSGGSVPAPVHLSLEPLHRRGWGSLYAALRHGQLDVPAVRALLPRYPLAAGAPVYAIDVSTWPRCDAETSPARGYYYHPSRHSAGQPIIAGWAYQWLVQLSFANESWTAPLDARRLLPGENVNLVAAEQIAGLSQHLPGDGPVPLFVFDAGYDPVQLTQAVPAPVAILVRLRSDRCFYAEPTAQPVTGRPRCHGHKFVCADPATWLPPTSSYQCADHQYGQVQLQAWANLHPKQQNHAARGTRRTRPVVPGTLIRMEVARLPARVQPPQVLWLWWHGPGVPDLALVWRAYVRRFDVEHTFRFVKQTLNWTTPRVRLPEQADRWTWIVVLAYTQLRLARQLVADRRLPWERSYPPGSVTPYRVRRVVSALLSSIGTPASGPKPCGRSPGRPRGRRSTPAPRYPALKKAA